MLPIRSNSGRYELVSIDSIAQVQFGHRQFPQIHVLPCGDWLVTFCWTDDAYFAKSGYLRSTNQGQTWTEGGWATDSGVLVPLGGQGVGIIDSYYPLHLQGDDYVVQGVFSTDGGRTFGPVEHRIPVHCPEALTYTLAEMMQAYFALPCYPWNRFFAANGYPPIAPGWPETAKQIVFGAAGPSSNTVCLDDGRLISMNYAKGTHPAVSVDYWFAFALESTDRGRSWRQVGAVPWEPSFAGEESLFGCAGFTEAALAQLANGDLLIVLRAGSGQPMGACRSSDAGRTWSVPESIRLGDDYARGVYPVMHRLHDNALACVYGRPGIHLMSDPAGNGRHWRHEFDFGKIEHALCRQLGSPTDSYYSTENVGLAEIAPGELAVTYDLWGWQGSKDAPSMRQTIRLARLREV